MHAVCIKASLPCVSLPILSRPVFFALFLSVLTLGSLSAQAQEARAPEPSALRTVVLLQGDALFDFDKDTLSASGDQAFEGLVARLLTLDELMSVHIIGHTDSTGDAAYNRDLSLRRAAAIARRLSVRFAEIHISYAGAGEEQPIADNATFAGRRANRRVEVEVVGIGNRAAWQANQ